MVHMVSPTLAKKAPVQVRKINIIVEVVVIANNAANSSALFIFIFQEESFSDASQSSNPASHALNVSPRRISQPPAHPTFIIAVCCSCYKNSVLLLIK
jgi:hypothetical protein